MKKTVLHCGPVLFEKIQDERFEEVFQSLNLPDTYHDALEIYYQQLCYQASYPMFESLFLELGKVSMVLPVKLSTPTQISSIIGILPMKIVYAIQNIPFLILI